VSTPPAARRPRSLFLILPLFAIPLVTAAALIAAFRGRPTPQPGPAQAPSSELEGQVAELQGELQVLRRQLQVLSREEPGATPPAEADKPPPAPPLTQEEVSARDKRRFEGLAGKLAAEPLDHSWGPATERLIATTLEKPAFKGSKLVEATCRSTLCRLEVRHETEGDRRKFSSALPTRLPSLPSGSMRNAEGPERKTIVYVAREGHRVPRDEPQ
jgi:hypothetical protein